jgi:hypothetical protein
MTTTTNAASHLLGALVAAMALLAGAAPVVAQQAGNPGAAGASSVAGSQRTQSNKVVAPKPSKRAASKRRVAVPAIPDAREQQPKPWSLEDALPSKRSSASPWTEKFPTISTPRFGRVPLEQGQGSFGFETETNVKANELSDGRPVPGLEATTRDSPSYFGLSLSVPSHDKSFLPAPVVPVPPWGRPE